MTDAASPAPTTIYALTIERFRGITSLKWKPSRSVNVILGGGDVGKTTILEAIALLLSPVNPTTLSDPDYYDRHIDAGFSIEAVLSMPAGGQMSSQMKPSWPWEWTGEEASVPTIEHDGQAVGEPVYRVRVRGTEDLELAYEIVQPDGSADSGAWLFAEFFNFRTRAFRTTSRFFVDVWMNAWSGRLIASKGRLLWIDS